MKNRTTFQRILAGTILIIVLSFMILSFSKAFAHFVVNKSSKDSILLPTNYYDKNTANLDWLEDDPDITGTINMYLRKEIQNAYLGAWHARNLSILRKENIGLNDHYIKEMVLRFESNFLQDENVQIHHQEHGHLLNLHTISLDNQLVSFTDHNVKIISKKRDMRNGKLLSTFSSTQSYSVVMTLDDGRWKINGLVPIKRS